MCGATAHLCAWAKTFPHFESLAMDRRGRLAETLNTGWRMSHGPFVRARRVARRWFAAIIEFNVPRGAGSAAVFAIIAGSVGYGIAAGGQAGTIATELHRTCDALAGQAGMRISSIALSGEKELSRGTILDLAGVSTTSSLPCLDAADTRAALLRNPWIAEATVLKLYPGRLQISVTERTPIALWQKGGTVSVIAGDGTVLEPFSGRFANLPQVVGEGAEKEAQVFLDIVSHYPLIANNFDAAVLVAKRRWNLKLKSGLDVRLPDTEVEQALQQLVALDRDKKILSRDITAIDLRLPDRVIVKLSDEAAAARAEVTKEILKKLKKKKGSDA
jgi:cell division protein FtsQ